MPGASTDKMGSHDDVDPGLHYTQRYVDEKYTRKERASSPHLCSLVPQFMLGSEPFEDNNVDQQRLLLMLTACKGHSGVNKSPFRASQVVRGMTKGSIKTSWLPIHIPPQNLPPKSRSMHGHAHLIGA